jgi:hypothetical protein
MKTALLLAGSVPLVIATSHPWLTDPELLEQLRAKGVDKLDCQTRSQHPRVGHADPERHHPGQGPGRLAGSRCPARWIGTTRRRRQKTPCTACTERKVLAFRYSIPMHRERLARQHASILRSSSGLISDPDNKNLYLSPVIARSEATKQSRRCVPLGARLLRFARNDNYFYRFLSEKPSISGFPAIVERRAVCGEGCVCAKRCEGPPGALMLLALLIGVRWCS